MSCQYCAAAQTDWACGLYFADCQGCNTRLIANSPKHVRDAEYRACKTPAEREKLKEAVKQEHARIRALRRETEDK